MVFRFRMLSDENDNFVRDYEALYDMTLLDFHNFILQSLEYEPCMASFFTADDRWEKQREFTIVDMGDGSGDAPAAMESVTLGQIIHNRRDRLIYLFDMFGDRAYFLELTGTFEADKGASYPREIYAQAAAPDQYDPSKTRVDDEGSIFGDVMSEFSDFEGDDNYDDEYYTAAGRRRADGFGQNGFEHPSGRPLRGTDPFDRFPAGLPGNADRHGAAHCRSASSR